MAISFADVTGITARTSKFIYHLGLKKSRNWIFCRKHRPILKEVKINLILIFSLQNLPIILYHLLADNDTRCRKHVLFKKFCCIYSNFFKLCSLQIFCHWFLILFLNKSFKRFLILRKLQSIFFLLFSYATINIRWLASKWGNLHQNKIWFYSLWSFF